jgi:hypothetical protein
VSGDASTDRDCEIAVAALTGCRNGVAFPEAELSVEDDPVGILSADPVTARDAAGNNSALR